MQNDPFDPSRPMNLNQCINSEPKLQKLIKEDKRVERLIDLSLKLRDLTEILPHMLQVW